MSAKERLKIYFHAILSMDFNLDQNEDRLFIWAGEETGSWESNAVELTVTKWVRFTCVSTVCSTGNLVVCPICVALKCNPISNYFYIKSDVTHPNVITLVVFKATVQSWDRM